MATRGDKEALVLLLDVGISMSTPINLNSTYLQTCADMIQMIIQRKMFQSSKDEIGLILFGSNETANDLWDGEHYGHVSVARPISEVDWKLLDYVQKKLHTTNIEGDVFDALIVAADQLHKVSQNSKYTEKRILMFTDFSTLSEDQSIDDICNSLKNNGIQLDVVSPFDDLGEDDEDEDNFKRHHAYNDENDDNKTQNKLQKKLMTEEQIKNQKLLKKISIETNGSLHSFNEVLSFLSLYQAKSVKSTGTKYTLDIGENFKLPIVSMIKVKENKPEMFRFKKVYAKDEAVELKTDRARFTKDDEQRDLDEKTEVVEAYRYGTTYIPIDNPDLLKYPVEKCFSVLGFTNADNVKRYYYIGDSVQQIIPDASNCDEEAQRAFLSMVEAMYDDKVYGIVRKVFNSRSSPEMGCLVPYIDANITCLLYFEIPYEDDIRTFPLENFCAIKKFKPSETQLKIVDNLIDSMDLKNLNSDEEDEEAYDPHATFNPYIQRMFQTIALKGNDPNAELPDFENHITSSYLKKFDGKIRNGKTNDILKRCADAFPTRVIEAKKPKLDATEIFNSKETKKEDKKENESNKDLNIDDLYKTVSNNLNKIIKIGTINPVNDFNVLLENCNDDDHTEIFNELVELIKQLLLESMQQGGIADDPYQTKAFDSIRALKDACIKHSQIAYFNRFLKDFKSYLFESNETSKYLQKIRVFFKNYFIAAKLTFLTTSSDYTDADANSFLELPIEDDTKNNEVALEKSNEDVEDLLDLM